MPTKTRTSIREPKTAAGGLPAVASSMKHSLRQMGPVRTLTTLTKLNQFEGFDCPGCAWPDPDGHRQAAEFCENGAKAVADEATTKRIDASFFARHSLSSLRAKSGYWLNQQGRLTEPMFKSPTSDHYLPISWDEALAKIGDRIRGLSSPNDAVFYTSGRTSNEAAFLYQLFARKVGTNNLPDCSNLCHESSGRALGEALGSGKGSVTLDDLESSQLILVVGQNPGTNHPRMLSSLQKAKRRGAKIVTINPLPEAGMMRFQHPQEVGGMLGSGTKLSDVFVQVRVNGDQALFKAMNKKLLEGGAEDSAFVEEFTTGFEAYRQSLLELHWADLVEQSGVDVDQVNEVCDLAKATDKIVCCWAMGLTQHRNAVATIQEVVNFLLLRGSIGKPGAGVCPVRGHSNVQGDRTMGICEKPTSAFLAALGREFDFDPPHQHGCDAVETARAMRKGEVRLFMAMGGNFVAAMSDTAAVEEGMARVDLTVQISTKLNRSHIATGREALILPCLGRTEADLQSSGSQFVSVENSMGVVHQSRGFLKPASRHLRSEPMIVASLAAKTFVDDQWDWLEMAGNYDRIRDRIARVIPGFEDYNRRVRGRGGFYLPHAVRDERRFATPSGRAQFLSNALSPISLEPDELIMMTIRSHDQYNTTVYALNDRYRGIEGERMVVLMHRRDMAKRDLQAGDRVDITSHYDRERRVCGFKVVPYDIYPGAVATYFPEANPIVPLNSTALGSNTPTSKSVIVRVAAS